MLALVCRAGVILKAGEKNKFVLRERAIEERKGKGRGKGNEYYFSPFPAPSPDSNSKSNMAGRMKNRELFNSP